MSKEEMIDILKGLVFGTFDRTTAKEREALDMAIKTLEQEPCEDAISRQRVLKLIKEKCNPYGKPTIDFEEGKKLLKYIDNLPSVTPQLKMVTNAEEAEAYPISENISKGFEEFIEKDIPKALEQEPCEDAIGRAELLQRSVISVPFHMSDGSVDYVDMVFAADICRAKPVQPQPKTGHWYRKHSWEICFTCSECGTTNTSGTKYNYCPSCGARMAEREG